VFIAGAVIQWLRDELGMIRNAAETDEIARTVNDTNGVYIVPAFVGLGAPYWDMHARGVSWESPGGQSCPHCPCGTGINCLPGQGPCGGDQRRKRRELSSLMVDGGASANDFLMQFRPISWVFRRPAKDDRDDRGRCGVPAAWVRSSGARRAILRNAERSKRFSNPKWKRANGTDSIRDGKKR